MDALEAKIHGSISETVNRRHHRRAVICMSIKKAAQGLIKAGRVVSEGLLNRIEMAFRAYDQILDTDRQAQAVHAKGQREPARVAE